MKTLSLSSKATPTAPGSLRLLRRSLSLLRKVAIAFFESSSGSFRALAFGLQASLMAQKVLRTFKLSQLQRSQRKLRFLAGLRPVASVKRSKLKLSAFGLRPASKLRFSVFETSSIGLRPGSFSGTFS